MSELNNPTPTRIAPAQAPTAAPGAGDGAVEVYRRAVEARPTGFTENPIGAMAQAVDRIGKAASRAVAGRAMEGRDGLAVGEERLKAAVEQMRAEPNAVAPKQRALTAALSLLDEMSSLAPNDPRRVRVSQFVVGLAGTLGATGIPFNAQGLDVRGLLRLAAQITSRYGTPQGMQAAFELEGLLRQTMPATSVSALAMRDQLLQRFNISPAAAAVLAQGWAVREAAPGELPKLDLTSRTMILDQTQANPSLGVMARAYWHDVSLRSPADRDGFIEAFLKIANQNGLPVLSRRYREVRNMARRELQEHRPSVLGSPSSTSAPMAASSSRVSDESADMFASVALFEQSPEAAELPAELREPLTRFYAQA